LENIFQRFRINNNKKLTKINKQKGGSNNTPQLTSKAPEPALAPANASGNNSDKR